MMADYPIGDPTGGPAYGEKRDPISAAVSLFAMYTSGTAIATAGMSLMAGLTFVGGALSLIGNITGNKTLSAIGAITGLAGGIGAFAESAGLFGEGNTLVGSLTKGSNVSLKEFWDSYEQTPVVNGVQGPGSASYMNAEAANVPNALNAPKVDVNTAPNIIPQAGPADVDWSARPSPYAIKTGGTAATPPAVAPLGEAAAAPTSDLNAVVNPFTAKTSTGLNVLPDDPTAVTKPTFMDSLKLGNFGDAASAAGSGVMDMLKTNPTGAYVVSKGIGAAVDYLSGKTDAELEQLKASTGYANAKALEVQTAIDREKEKRANKNMAYNTIDAGFKPPGLIRSNMQST